jgi:hypothetical protein
MSKRTYAWRNGELVELSAPQIDELHYVQDDIQEFRSPDGAMIGGKRQWREHLKRTGTMEMGHSDVRASQEKWQKRKEAHHEKIAKAGKMGVQQVETKEGGDDIRPAERSRINCEVLNRLEGRPAPDRKTLIKLALETARRYGGRS